MTATYTYDALDAQTGISYSDAGTANPTPRVLRSYNAGWLTYVNAGGTNTTFGYDPLGRIGSSTQNTNGVDYIFAYTWNLADGLLTEKYP